MTAADLAAADVVLTSYDVLRRDLHHCPDTGGEGEGEGEEAGYNLRGAKRYEVGGGAAASFLPCCSVQELSVYQVCVRSFVV